MLIALMVRRYLVYERRLHSRVIAAWRPLLTRIAIEGEEAPALPPLPHRHLPYLMEEWNALNDAVRGESSARLNAAALKLGFDVAARRLIHSRRVGRRILAIRTLGHLRDPSSWKPLQEQLELRECARLVLRGGCARSDRRAASDARHHEPARGARELAGRGDGAAPRGRGRRRRAGADSRADALVAPEQDPAAPALARARGCRARQRSRDRVAAP